MSANSATNTISIEVAYALPDNQQIIALDVPVNTPIVDAIKMSKITSQFNTIDMGNLVVGIFGKKVPLDYTLRHKDRIEIYRPLIIDPQTARLNRLKKLQQQKK